MSDLTPWIPTLEPPAGGYSRLVDAMSARNQRRGVRARWQVGLATACIGALVLVLAPMAAESQRQRLQERRIAQTLERAWEESARSDLTVTDGAAMAVLKAPGVRLYWVSAMPSASAAAKAPEPAQSTSPNQ